MKNFYNIDRLLKNVNVLQVGTGKNPTTPLYSDTKISENFLIKENINTTKREHTFKCFASTFNAEIVNSFNPELRLKDTEFVIKNKLKKLLHKLKGFKFVTTIVLVFKKIARNNKTNFDNFYSSSKAAIIINENDINNIFKSIYPAIIRNIQKSFAKDLG